ncbi:helix-turn-helix domain-containing protein, partial [Petralouisia muris]
MIVMRSEELEEETGRCSLRPILPGSVAGFKGGENRIMNENQKISFQIYGGKEKNSNWTENLEICYVLQGKGTLAIAGKGKWKIQENDIFVLNMYETYQMLLELEGIVLSLSVPESFALNLYPEMGDRRIECFSFLLGQEYQKHYERIREYMADIFAVYCKNAPQEQLRMRGLASGLLSELLISFGQQKPENRGESGREQVLLLTGYVREHYQEDISLRKFAEENYLSASHLSHLMRKEVGVSFTEYLKMVRLQYAMRLLDQGKSVTEISVSTGFVNTNAFIKAFRDTYGVTPGKYKKERQKKIEESIIPAEIDMDMPDVGSHLFDKLFTYLSKDTGEKRTETNYHESELRQFRADVRKAGNTMSGNWKFSINGGYAKGLLTECVQKAVHKVQEEIGFRYIRCKGIFDDELQICSRDMNGNLIFNYVFLDYILDFICSNHACPWIELSYMPSALCRKKQKKKEELWLIAMPDEPQEWLEVVRQLLLHIRERYGEKEVSRWLITPFADVFLVNMHMENQDGYFELYGETYQLIRNIMPRMKIAARGTFETEGEGLGNYMVGNHLLPDYWTMVKYNSVFPQEEESELELIEYMEAYSMVTSRDTDYLKHQIQLQKRQLEEHGAGKTPLLLAEWNSTIWQRDLCNDTAYKSCYLLKNILENCNDISGFSYWQISDWSYEYAPSSHRYHGGFGLFTLFLTVIWTTNRCNPSIYTGYSDLNFRN